MNDEHIQVLATWTEGSSPAAARSSPERVAYTRTVEEMFAAQGIESFQSESSFDEIDDDTIEASQQALAEGLFSIVNSDGVDLGGIVPLLFAHAGPALATELDISVKGREFRATGWVPVELADQVRDVFHCSPGLKVTKARIVDDFGLRFLHVIESRLVEVSATPNPLREGTQFAVAPRPGMRMWALPSFSTAERFSIRETGVVTIAYPGKVEVF